MNYDLITIDSGNSSTTIIGHKEDQMFELLTEELNEIPNSIIIQSSVLSEHTTSNLKTINLNRFLKNQLFFDMPINYSETLGIDRIVTAYSYFKIQQETILIDAGTFITIDHIDSKGFSGGLIIPGIELLRATYECGDLLTKPQKKDIKNIYPAHSTIDATGGGIGFIIGCTVERLIHKYPNAQVIITGGDAQTIKRLVKCGEVESKLIHKSMKQIYKENL